MGQVAGLNFWIPAFAGMTKGNLSGLCVLFRIGMTKPRGNLNAVRQGIQRTLFAFRCWLAEIFAEADEEGVVFVEQ